VKQEAEERIDELETQLQNCLLEIHQKDARIRELNQKFGNPPNAELDHLEAEGVGAEVNSTRKLKDVIKQLNKDHEAER